MPEVRIEIGGRSFDVACAAGEEHFLHSAAAMLNAEAEVLTGQMGRLPEARMLLMAGLMLADKTAGFEDQLRATQERAEAAEAALAEAMANPARIEVPVTPEIVVETFAEIAAQTEALAQRIDELTA